MEHLESPEQELSARFAAQVTLAAQVLEAALRVRQRREDTAAAADAQRAAAARAERLARHAADRVRWERANDSAWLNRDATETQLGRLGDAWTAAAAWADTDPAADRACQRVEERLGEVAPEAMRRFEDLRDAGQTRWQAMTAVASDLQAERRARHDSDQPPPRDRVRDTAAPERNRSHDRTPRPRTSEPPGADRPRRTGADWFRVDNREWLAAASTGELAAAWDDALAAADGDPFAARAARRIGGRLAEVHPGGAAAAGRYRAERARGQGHDGAFRSARGVLDATAPAAATVIDGHAVGQERRDRAGGSRHATVRARAANWRVTPDGGVYPAGAHRSRRRATASKPPPGAPAQSWYHGRVR